MISLSTDFFFFNDTATTEIYTLSLHDALPIFATSANKQVVNCLFPFANPLVHATLRRSDIPSSWLSAPKERHHGDRKSTRLNSSHANISYAVFCLKKTVLGGAHAVAEQRLSGV